MTENEKRFTTISVTPDIREELQERMEYGDSYSSFLREELGL